MRITATRPAPPKPQTLRGRRTPTDRLSRTRRCELQFQPVTGSELALIIPCCNYISLHNLVDVGVRSVILPRMGILIGMDEAGYGPNYGPLVVAATAWEVPNEGPEVGAQEQDCGELASTGLSSPKSAGGKLGRSSPPFLLPLPHSPLHTRPPLPTSTASSAASSPRNRANAASPSPIQKRSTLPASACDNSSAACTPSCSRYCRQSLACWSAIIEYCEADPDGHHKTACWPDGFDLRPPDRRSRRRINSLGSTVFARLRCRRRPTARHTARLVFPAQFNDLVAHYGSKGAALSHITVGLLREVMDSVCSPAPSSQPPAPDLRRLRQTRRPQLLHRAAPASLLRTLDRTRSRKPRRKPLRMGAARGPHARRVPHEWRAILADGAGLDDGQVPARAFHARLQRVLVRSRSRSPPHRRLPERLRTASAKPSPPSNANYESTTT